MATFLHGLPQGFYLRGSPSPVEWATVAKLNISCPAIGDPLVPGAPTEEQNGLPGDKTMASIIWSSGQASWSMSVIKLPPHTWDSWG